MAVRITYTAIIDQDEMIIRQAYHAGVDGPIKWLPRPVNLDDADTVLKAQGFERTEPWNVKVGYAGMTLEAELSEV